MYGDPVGLATNGPLARTVRDAAAFLDVMAGRAVGDPFWAPEDADDVPARRATASRAGLRIARFSDPVIADAVIDPECLAAWEDDEPAAGVARPRGRRRRGAAPA